MNVLPRSAFLFPLTIVNVYRNGIQGIGYGFLPMMAGVAELSGRGLMAVIAGKQRSYLGICLASPVAWIFADTLLVTVYFVKMKSLKVQLAQPAPAAC